MKISAQFAMWTSAIFALLCLGVAFSGFSSLDAMTDEVARSDARGYAFFWLFLGAVAVAAGLASWWMVGQEDKHSSDR
jgi:hypothetical protein